MAIRLAAPSGPDATQTVSLEGRRFRLRWRWLQLLARWALDVLSPDGTLLAGGLAVVPNLDLFADCRGGRPEFPLGALFVVDSRELPQAPGLETLGGTNAQIVYLDSTELA